jgi:hypothetical protein
VIGFSLPAGHCDPRTEVASSGAMYRASVAALLLLITKRDRNMEAVAPGKDRSVVLSEPMFRHAGKVLSYRN